mmetsp:Transcript_24555/g.37096  ORF Transcript_24555/g.37096 Transcript_24555/m.37096 type:complete len:201 (-) Transcript_24555:571-1173(-)
MVSYPNVTRMRFVDQITKFGLQNLVPMFQNRLSKFCHPRRILFNEPTVFEMLCKTLHKRLRRNKKQTTIILLMVPSDATSKKCYRMNLTFFSRTNGFEMFALSTFHPKVSVTLVATWITLNGPVTPRTLHYCVHTCLRIMVELPNTHRTISPTNPKHGCQYKRRALPRAISSFFWAFRDVPCATLHPHGCRIPTTWQFPT